MEIQSPHPPLDIPETDIWGFLFERRTEFPPDKEIYIDPLTTRSYTFQDVKDTSINFGRALLTRWNWQKGDVMTIFSPNCIDNPALTWGTLWANGVVSPSNPSYSVSELTFHLRDSGSKGILTQVPYLRVVLEAARKVGIPVHRILLMGEERSQYVIHFTDLLQVSEGVLASERRVQKPDDLAFLVYSSGTTGLPKGVRITQRNLIANTMMLTVAQSELSWNGGPEKRGDTVLAVLPFYHIYGVSFLTHHTLCNGLRVIVFPQFSLETFCKAIHDYKVTIAYIAPPIVLQLSKSPIIDKYDLSSLKVLMSAAAPLTESLVQAVWNRLRVPIKQAYGLSEATGATHVQEIQKWHSSIGSVGHLLPNLTAKFLSSTGEVLPSGFIGEICIKGPSLFTGYHKNPTATSEAFTDDNYFRSGDIGYQDTNGNLYITDRVKELIKYKGFQVAPAELEGILVGNSMVADACVLGVYDEGRATEVPRAYIVLSEDGMRGEKNVVERMIIEWVDGRVAGYKRLRGGVQIVEEIPKSASGKILRRVLRARFGLKVNGKDGRPKL